MGAVSSALRQDRGSFSKRLPKRKKKVNGKVKVIDLLKEKKLRARAAAVKPSGLLNAVEREETILEYRVKARTIAHSILRRWHSRIDGQEVESIVDLSLCEAVRRFDRSKGASFITFLFYHLRGNLIRAVTTAVEANFVPLPDADSIDAVLSGRNDGMSRSVNAIDVAHALCHNSSASPDEALLKKEISSLSSEACSELDPLEREVIYRIFIQEQQLTEIANLLGYSRCHISRVKKKALQILHSHLAQPLEITSRSAELEEGDSDEAERPARRVVYRRRSRERRVMRLASSPEGFTGQNLDEAQARAA